MLILPVTRAVLAALAALLVSAPAAHAAAFPTDLPGDVTASSVRADPDTWIVGAKPSGSAARIARRYGAHSLGLGGYVLAKSRARAFADALRARHLLVYAQANILRKPLQAVPDDPLSAAPNDWRKKVVDPSIAPPPVTDSSPMIALVDAAADVTHPEWTGDRFFSTLPGHAVTNQHGTATASVAAAPLNGIGILGVWPGARAVNVPLATIPGTDGEITCAASGDAIEAAVKTGAAVINMSYGSVNRCIPEWIQIYYGVAKGVIPVAAAGNEFESGNPLEFPASLPHVVTVAATTPDDKSASFSNANAAIDLSAPGVGILAAVPPALDTDGVQDGYEALNGTSFSAPMVSAALAWIRAARPDLPVASVVEAVRLGARDVERPGWDALTGFGVLDIGKSLALTPAQLPPPDPFEPNDNIVWVNGKAFGKKSDPIWSGGKQAQLVGALDKQEDPVDTYRIVIPGHTSARISVTPGFGDPSLEVFNTSAESVNDEAGRVARSRLAGSKKTERVTVRNNSANKRSYYVAVKPQGNSRYQERRYTLRVR